MYGLVLYYYDISCAWYLIPLLKHFMRMILYYCNISSAHRPQIIYETKNLTVFYYKKFFQKKEVQEIILYQVKRIIQEWTFKEFY